MGGPLGHQLFFYQHLINIPTIFFFLFKLGAPSDRGAQGNCPLCPPINPALVGLKLFLEQPYLEHFNPLRPKVKRRKRKCTVIYAFYFANK